MTNLGSALSIGIYLNVTVPRGAIFIGIYCEFAMHMAIYQQYDNGCLITALQEGAILFATPAMTGSELTEETRQDVSDLDRT